MKQVSEDQCYSMSRASPEEWMSGTKLVEGKIFLKNRGWLQFLLSRRIYICPVTEISIVVAEIRVQYRGLYLCTQYIKYFLLGINNTVNVILGET